MAGSSLNGEKHFYMRGYSWWSKNAFWRSPLYSAKVQKQYEKSLEEMRQKESRLIRL